MTNNLPAPMDPAARPPTTLSMAEGLALTRQVNKARKTARTATAEWLTLLLKAHDERAWAAVGSPSWNHYVQDKLDMTTRHANRLVEQARVHESLSEALADLFGELPPKERDARPALSQSSASPPMVSQRQSEVLNKDLTAATDEIAEAVAAGATPAEAVTDAVAKRRQATPAEVVPDPNVSEIVLDPDGLDTLGGQPAARPRLRDLPDQTPPLPRPITSPGMIGPKRQGPTCIRCKGSGVEPVRAHTATVRHGAERPAPKDCAHPLTMRLGKGCGLCLKDPV